MWINPSKDACQWVGSWLVVSLWHYCSHCVSVAFCTLSCWHCASQVVQDVRDDAGNVALVGYHPMLAERAARQAVERGLLSKWLGPHTHLASQQTFGATRVDYVLHHADGAQH